MSLNPVLHARLMARQSDAELDRKAEKAWERRGGRWTREELDAADRKAEHLYRALNDLPPYPKKPTD